MSVRSPDADAWTSFAVTAAPRAELAVLDRTGVIAAVNDAWTDFARGNGCSEPARCGPGVSYLAICDAAADEVSAAVAAGIRQAVAGALPVPVRVVVPCDSPDRSRLFVTLVSSRFGDDGDCLGATVVLIPVSDASVPPAHPDPGNVGSGSWSVLPVEALRTPGDWAPGGWLAGDGRTLPEPNGSGVTPLGTVEDLIRRQAAILDLVPDAVITTDPVTEQILYVNDAACRLLGYSRGQLLGMGTSRLHPDLPDRDRRARIADLVARPGTGPLLTDIRLWSREGRRIDGESHSAAVTDESGRAIVVHVLRDVRERTALIEQLRVAAASFQTVFDQSPIAALVIRLDQGRPRLVRVNQAASQLFGDSIEALIAADPAESGLPAGDLAAYSRVRQYRRRDGSHFWAEGQAVPIRLPDLTGRLALVHLVDVSDRRAAETRRAQTAAAHQLITRVVTAVLAGQGLPDSYRQVVEGVADVFGAADVSIVLPEPGTERFTVVGAHGPVAAQQLTTTQQLTTREFGTREFGTREFATQEFVRWLMTRADHGLIVPATAPGLPAPARGRLAATRFEASPTGASGVLIMARAPDGAAFILEEVELLTVLTRQLTLAIRLGQAQSEQQRVAADRDAYLAQLDEALRPLSDPADIQTVACRSLGEHLKASRVLYADIEDERVAVVRHEYLHGAGSLAADGSLVAGLAPIDVLRGEPLVIDDIVADGRFGSAERREVLGGIASGWIVVPLVKSDRFIAAFSVHSARPRHWTDLEVQLALDTAERTWAAVERSLAEQASVAERARRRVAERELLEQAARERRERLEQEFITNAAHELRTPLTGILAAVDALDAGAVDDPRQRRRFLAHLRRESTRLSRLSDSLLLLAQAQSFGSLPAEPFAVDVLLATVAAELHVASAVTVSVDVDENLTLRGHQGLTEVLIGNLASNAARYTTAGHIRLSAHAGDGAVVLAVRDTGPGMSEDALRRARDRFYRHGGARGSDGFGLGLSIAAQAAAAMGVALDLRSIPGTGTCARVTFHPPGDPAPGDLTPGDLTPGPTVG